MKKRSHWPISLLSGAASAVNLMLPLILVRTLPAHEIGIFKVFFLYLSLAPTVVLTTGLRSGLAYWGGQGEQGRDAIQASSLLVLLIGIICSSSAVLAHPILAATLGWERHEALLFSLALFAGVTSSFFEEAAIATGRIWTGALVYSLFEIARSVILVSVVLCWKTLDAVLIAHTAVMTAKTAVTFAWGTRISVVGISSFFTTVRPVLRYAAPVSIAWIFGIFVNNADQIILSRFLEPVDFALYTIGCLSLPPIFILEQSVTRVLIPQLSQAFARNQPAAAAQLYSRAVAELGALIIPVVIALTIYASPIIEVLFTSQYAAASKYLSLYALTYIFMIAPYDAIARARGDSSWILRNFLAFSCIALTAAISATWYFGAFGALCAALFTAAGMRASGVWYGVRAAGLKLHQLLPFMELGKFAALGLTLAIPAALARSSFSDQRMWFLVTAPIYLALYFAALLIMQIIRTRARAPRTILMLTQTLEIGGLERMILHLCQQLRTSNHWQLVIFAYNQPEQAQDQAPAATLIQEYQDLGVPLMVHSKPPGFSPAVVARVLWIVAKHNVDIVHTHDIGGLIYASLSKLLSLMRIRIVHTQHSFIHIDQEPKYLRYERMFTRYADILVAVSEDIRLRYRALNITKKPISVVPNGVTFRSTLRTSEEKLRTRQRLATEIPSLPPITLQWILYLARIFPGKGQRGALDIWNHLSGTVRTKSALIFVGPPTSQDEYQSLLTEIALAPDREHIAVVPGTRTPQSWLDASDIYLSSSVCEGMPLGPLEAAGGGVPSVLSEIPGHAVLERSAAMYPLDDCARGARIIEALLDQPDEVRSSRAWQAGSSLRSSFSIAAMAASYDELYRSFGNHIQPATAAQPAASGVSAG